MTSRLTCVMLALLLLPSLVFGVTQKDREVQYTGESGFPEDTRGDEWIIYDDGDWDYTWSSEGTYMCNLFFPRDISWYPFQVSKVQFLYGKLEGNTTGAGTVSRVRVFDAVPAPVTEWVGLPATVNVWQTLTAAAPPVVLTGDPFYAGGWLDDMDSPNQGTVDFGLWPGPYWPVGNNSPFIFVGGQTSAATTGWSTTLSTYPTTSVASFRVLVSGETVPVELYGLEGKVRRGYVALSWRTASEQANYGFNVYRSDVEDGQYTKINDQLILGHGTSAEPHDYAFADYHVERSQTYYYKVEDVATDGASTFHGPLAVPVGNNFASSWGEIKAEFK